MVFKGNPTDVLIKHLDYYRKSFEAPFPVTVKLLVQIAQRELIAKKAS